MKKFFTEVLICCIILFALSSCKAFRLTTEKTEISVESAGHILDT